VLLKLTSAAAVHVSGFIQSSMWFAAAEAHIGGLQQQGHATGVGSSKGTQHGFAAAEAHSICTQQHRHTSVACISKGTQQHMHTSVVG
jgi:hypothetical protein